MLLNGEQIMVENQTYSRALKGYKVIMGLRDGLLKLKIYPLEGKSEVYSGAYTFDTLPPKFGLAFQSIDEVYK